MNLPDFIHSKDVTALETLKKFPVLASIIKAFMLLSAEQLQTEHDILSIIQQR